MIFFDIDGTLVDHKKADSLGVKDFYSNQCKYFNCSENEFYEKWNETSIRNFKRFLNRELSYTEQGIERAKDIFLMSNINLSNEDAEEKFKLYVSFYEENIVPYNDVLPTLQLLKNHRLGIISNGYFNQQMLKLEKICDPKIFDVVITASEVKVSKPSIEIFKIACDKANVSINECFYIGDDIKTDMFPCIEAGMKGIWINRTKEVTKYKDFNIVNDLRDLSKFI